jgi:1-deoxy-D-xylulose-5-phosphate synthase
MRFIKPLDTELLDRVASRFVHVVTLEDNTMSGGFGSAVAEYFASKGVTSVRVKIHGLPDRFIDHGTPAELYRDMMLDPPGIAAVVRDFLPRPKDRVPSQAAATVTS